jgi:hypothetical protein
MNMNMSLLHTWAFIWETLIILCFLNSVRNLNHSSNVNVFVIPIQYCIKKGIIYILVWVINRFWRMNIWINIFMYIFEYVNNFLHSIERIYIWLKHDKYFRLTKRVMHRNELCDIFGACALGFFATFFRNLLSFCISLFLSFAKRKYIYFYT